MSILRLIAFVIIAVVIEVPLLLKARNTSGREQEDPMVLPYKARKVTEPSFNYIPGRSTYDDKSGRFVTDWKYEWEYRGKKHSMMFCDNPNSQYEHYLMVFPDEIDITIHRETGKYYVSKTVRTAGRRNLWILLIAVAASWFITGLLLG